MTVEQWLTDLEDKAKFATPGPWVMDGVYPIYSVGRGGLKDKTIGHVQRQWDGDFIAAANPAAVLRLVGMVRWLAPVLHKFCEDICTPYKIGNGTCTECPLMQDGKCIVSAEAMLSTAYAETENHHD